MIWCEQYQEAEVLAVCEVCGDCITDQAEWFCDVDADDICGKCLEMKGKQWRD